MSTTTTPNTAALAPMHNASTTNTAASLGDAVAAALADATPALTPAPEPGSKRTEANRKNSKRSTGPRSLEGRACYELRPAAIANPSHAKTWGTQTLNYFGDISPVAATICEEFITRSKAKVSMNALKHGLTANNLVLPGEDLAALQDRIDSWKDGLRPRNPLEDLLAQRLAIASWRADRADRAIAARLTLIMLDADADELAAEVAEVEDLGRRLYWDPAIPCRCTRTPGATAPPRASAPPTRSTTRSTRRGSSISSR